MRAMERPDPQQDPQQQPAPATGDMGEDHRDGPPGYDLDEQAAIEELETEREGGSEGS
jgi:hypothetical protein